MHRFVFCATAFITLLGPLPIPSHARTWHVTKDRTGDFSTVQAGINAASVGDTVLVGPGTYHEYIQFQGRDISVRSSEGPEVTVLDAMEFDRSVVYVTQGESRATILQGFTITGGNGANSPPPFRTGGEGGGIFILNSEPTIRQNVIVHNTVIGSSNFGLGGGIFCYAELSGPVKRPLIKDNIITDNLAAGNGGGIAAWSNTAPEIVGNSINLNTVTWGDGGGVWLLLWASGAVVNGNQIIANRVGDHGGGIYAGSSTSAGIALEIGRNLVYNNIARGRALNGHSGGGIWLARTTGVVENNTIVGNRGEGPGNSYGGNLVLLRPTSPRIERNIIALATVGGGVLCFDQATPTFLNNLTWANDGGDGVGLCPNWFIGNGNIQADPLFCGARAGDFSLPPNSPALTHPVGPLGAIPELGCSAGVTVISATWGSIKARFAR